MEPKKLYYTMGEVSEMFCVTPSLIRHWESHFSVIKPVRNKKGNRLFTPTDIENFKVIYHLVKERGMTLDGAQKCMRHNVTEHKRNAELLERLQTIRAVLLEVREGLKDLNSTDYKVSDYAESNNTEKLVIDLFGEVVSTTHGSSTPESGNDLDIVEVLPYDNQSEDFEQGQPFDHSTRGVNRTPDAKPSELFAFYEQSLF